MGNLLVAEYQVDRLRTRLADLVEGFRPGTEMRSNKTSTHAFKHKNKWYKLSLRIDEETNADSTKDNGLGAGKNNQFTRYSRI